MEQRDGVQVENGLGLGMVAQLGVVAGEAEQVLNAQGGGAQQVRLQGDAVTVAAGHLEDGGEAGVLQDLAGGHGAQTHDGGLVIGHVDGGNLLQVGLGFLHQVLQMDALGGADFRRNYKFTTFKQVSNIHCSLLLFNNYLETSSSVA